MDISTLKKTATYSALKIALIYSVFSVLWIMFSDQILYLAVKNIETATRIQTIKGWIFVLATAGLIFVLLQREISRYRRVQTALREGEERYRFLVENAPLGIVAVDTAGAILTANPMLVEILGAPDVESTKIINMFTFPPLVEAGISDNCRQCLETGRPGVFETKYVTKWGKDVFLRYHLQAVRDKTNRITGVQGIVEDISVAARLEEELRQAQKMEALGTLAGGVAHDFNNILSAIIGYTELAQMELDEKSTVWSNMEMVVKSGIRAKNLVEQILTFSRKSQRERKPILLAPLLEEALQLLRATLPSTIEINKKIAEGEQLVLADSTMIHQVMINLCGNAADAMRETGGTLTVSLDEYVQDEHSEPMYPNLNPGKYEMLTVADTGPGMARNVLDRIFDPFYTTKEQGKGSGMGLAVVHGAVKSHGGIIQVSSRIGAGTKFEVLLPVVEGLDPQEPVPVSELAAGHERILFVDDEPNLVEIGKKMLERLGYQVETRVSSREALKAVEEGEGPFDLVITDQTMPNMTGAELARAILKLKPDLPVILCTGYSDSITAEQADAIGVKAFLMKPLVFQEFVAAVRLVLDKTRQHI